VCVAVVQLITSLLLSRSSEDVREQLPRVDESVVLCPLSRRQNFIYSDYLANRFSAVLSFCCRIREALKQTGRLTWITG